MICGGQRDGASVNGNAAKRLKFAFSLWYDLICIPHTLSLTGDHVELTTLNAFMVHWIALVSPAGAANALWRRMTGYAPRSFSKTRWHSRTECALDTFKRQQYLPEFMSRLQKEGIGDAHTKAMVMIVKEELPQLILEMAALKDIGTKIVELTFLLEGDKLEILLAYNAVQAFLVYGESLADPARNGGLLPSTDAELVKLKAIKVGQTVQRDVQSKLRGGKEVHHGTITSVGDDEVRVDWTGSRPSTRSGDATETMTRNEVQALLDAYCDERRAELVNAFKPALVYLRERIEGNCIDIFSLEGTMLFCKLVRVFDPSWLATNLLCFDDEYVKNLCELAPFGPLYDRLRKEAAAYRAAVADCVIDSTDANTFTEGVLQWWRVNGPKIPAWAEGARICFAFRSNSAAAERIFSLLKSMFTPQQAGALMDTVEGSLMMRHNGRGKA